MFVQSLLRILSISPMYFYCIFTANFRVVYQSAHDESSTEPSLEYFLLSHNSVKLLKPGVLRSCDPSFKLVCSLLFSSFFSSPFLISPLLVFSRAFFHFSAWTSLWWKYCLSPSASPSQPQTARAVPKCVMKVYYPDSKALASATHTTPRHKALSSQAERTTEGLPTTASSAAIDDHFYVEDTAAGVIVPASSQIGITLSSSSIMMRGN